MSGPGGFDERLAARNALLPATRFLESDGPGTGHEPKGPYGTVAKKDELVLDVDGLPVTPLGAPGFLGNGGRTADQVDWQQAALPEEALMVGPRRAAS